MEMYRWHFQGFPEIQNGRDGPTSIFWWAQKLKKLVWSIFLNFNITFLATCGCAIYFLKMLPKFKMSARSQLQFFFFGAKTLKLNVRNYSNFTATLPTIWRCACDFFKVLREFKMAAMHELYNFVGAKKLWSEIMCRWFYWNLKWPSQVHFLNICDHKASNLIYGGGWYRTSVLLFMSR